MSALGMIFVILVLVILFIILWAAYDFKTACLLYVGSSIGSFIAVGIVYVAMHL